MSGGAIAVAPVVMGGAALAAVAVVVVAAVAVALVVRAAQAGTEATGRALEQFGAEMEQTANAQDDLAVRTRLWELAAGAVVRTNSEICLLTARAQQAGVLRPALPPPVDLTGLSLATTRDRVAQAQAALAQARTAIEDAEAEREQRILITQLPKPADGSPTAAQTLAHYRKVLAARKDAPAVQVPAPVPAEIDKDRIGTEIDRILLRLDTAATADERAEAVLAAAHAAKQTDPGMASTHLDRLIRVVDVKINPKAARRKEAAGFLSALQHPVVAAAIGETDPRPPFLRSLETLQGVVSGDADLTDADRRDAQDSLAWAEKAVERRQLLQALNETFTRLGYKVTNGLATHHAGQLSVASDRWNGGHSADVWIDDQGGVQFRMVELAEGATGEAVHCEQLNQAMGTVGTELEQRGFQARVTVPKQAMKPVRRWTADHRAEAEAVEQSGGKTRAKDLFEEDDK
ncbi:hypothetical protein Cs7R123_63030 [Catellatospora sp. TT07R-123]|uniref:hypothetical protein n=1 Tax=Catellatospora sp. TT07R-123 TaxID=2733863 RepID=UPI001B224817|nr:hypothetical protein [Catellatospora sp. TT07R-123]GHJ48961.1 hypothetical protein Cs7R123_63030 [Catellatospora sp. TT07R-123]